MIFRLKVEFPGRAPQAGFDVVVFILARRNVFVRQVGNSGEEGIQGFLDGTQFVFRFSLLALQVVHFLQQRLDILARCLGLADGPGTLVLLALQCFRTNLDGSAAFL